MTSNPLISVIMPVSGKLKYLTFAIDSILKQSISDFELIIINDGTDINLKDTISEYHDNRIIEVGDGIHYGISHALNWGIKLSHGKYIARMDCDDISEQNRFYEQIHFLECQPNIDACGTQMSCIMTDTKTNKTYKTRSTDQEIRLGLFWGESSLAHPTLMLRKSSIDKFKLYYDSDYDLAEDYEMYCRYCNVLKFANIPIPLLQYRVHNDSSSVKQKCAQRKRARKILRSHLSRAYDLHLSDFEFNIHSNYKLPYEDYAWSYEDEIKWEDKLYFWNKQNQFFSEMMFEMEIERRHNEMMRRMKHD